MYTIGLLGFLGFVICFVLLIIAIVKRMKKKGYIIGMLVFALLFVFGIGTYGNSLPDEDDPQTIVNGGEKLTNQDSGIWASKFTPINDFDYELDKSEKTITLLRYQGEDEKILLSPVYTIDGEDYTLISMGGEACFLGELSITSVYIPEGVKYIGENCFNSCTNLEYIYIPSTIDKIGSEFFGYLGEYEVYCDSTSNLPEERDVTNYEEIENDKSDAYKLGESAGKGFSSMIYGFVTGDNEVITKIYFGGSEEQWNAL